MVDGVFVDLAAVWCRRENFSEVARGMTSDERLLSGDNTVFGAEESEFWLVVEVDYKNGFNSRSLLGPTLHM